MTWIDILVYVLAGVFGIPFMAIVWSILLKVNGLKIVREGDK